MSKNHNSNILIDRDSKTKGDAHTIDVGPSDQNHPMDKEGPPSSERMLSPEALRFGIDVSELEKIMGLYKERGTNYADLEYFERQGGVEKLLKALETDTERGIADISGREEAFGSNKVFVEEARSFWEFVLEAFQDTMVQILVVAAIVQIVLGVFLSDNGTDWVDGLSIVVAILVVVLVGSITNYQKEQKFRELNDIQSEGTKYTVIRNGQPEQHISDDLLVGDLLMVNYGEIIPADILLVEGNGIKMDESALTGESDAMRKENFGNCMAKKMKGESKLPSHLILSGTNCVEGSGKAIIIAVGDHSQKGIIRRTVDNAQQDAKTPLEEKLETIADMIGWFGMGAGLVTLVALFIRFGISFSKEMSDYNESSKVESVLTAFLQNIPSLSTNPQIYSNTNNNLTDPKGAVPKKILDIIILCVSIVVVAVPEGLPLAVTLSLAFSIKKLMDYNNLVRKMHACETMGGANYICTDKTGTLTKNEMNVFTVLTGKSRLELNQNMEVEDVGEVAKRSGADQEKKEIREDYTKIFNNAKYWEILKVALALNVDCTIKTLNKPTINGDLEIAETKNKTDKAFIDFLYRFKSPISEQKKKYLKEGSFKEFPFDSKRKRMTTFISNQEFPTDYRLFTKGGGENSVKYCKYYLDPETGERVQLSDQDISYIKENIEDFNKNKLRSLYVAFKDISAEEYTKAEQENKQGLLVDQYDLVFVAVFGIRDSLRDGVKESVLKCHEAGVNVIMVTGDNIVTATAIAKDCNILDDSVDLKNLGPKDIEEDPELIKDEANKDKYIEKLLSNKPKAMTGNSFYTAVGGLICDVCKKETNACQCPKTENEAKQLAQKTGEEQKEIKKDVINNMENFKALTKNLRVMARSQPLHKYALVLGLKTLKNVVAVTGDGTNDAPALSKSDVGFAMFAGTDIAKEASDIVILDNNFSSIVVAIIYGRNIYDNIRKFLQFQLTVNFCACILVFLCACIGNETPLTPIQMLWVNLIMDSLGSLALATEPPYNELLQRLPTKRSESIINGRMWKHIAIQSLVQIIILLVLYLVAPEFIKEDNSRRKTENSLIYLCYGKMPGGGDLDHIIYGTEGKWTSGTKLSMDIDHKDCGNYGDKQNLSVAFKEYTDANGATTHMSIIFTVFVFYTLFNQVNCRVLDDSINIFKRISSSLLFVIITLVEMGLQVLIVFIGNSAFHVCEGGLSGKQWGISIGFSAITFVVSFIVKFIPLEDTIDGWLSKYSDEEEEDENGGERKIDDDKVDSKRVHVLHKDDEYIDIKSDELKKDGDVLKMSDNKISQSDQETQKQNGEKENQS